MRMVDDWHSAWKWLSIQIAIVGAALQAAILAFPSVKDWVGDTVAHGIGLVILIGVVMGRVVAQDGSNGPADKA